MKLTFSNINKVITNPITSVRDLEYMKYVKDALNQRKKLTDYQREVAIKILIKYKPRKTNNGIFDKTSSPKVLIRKKTNNK